MLIHEFVKVIGELADLFDASDDPLISIIRASLRDENSTINSNNQTNCGIGTEDSKSEMSRIEKGFVHNVSVDLELDQGRLKAFRLKYDDQTMWTGIYSLANVKVVAPLPAVADVETEGES